MPLTFPFFYIPNKFQKMSMLWDQYAFFEFLPYLQTFSFTLNHQTMFFTQEHQFLNKAKIGRGT